tara:strand:- start:12766 stop:12936 length:171 start_codon:yes stop_codon:yes gene_type:complete
MTEKKEAFNTCEKLHNDVTDLYEALADEEKIKAVNAINRIRKSLDMIRARTLLSGN